MDEQFNLTHNFPDSKVHGANMGPTWVLSAPDGPHDGPMNLAIRVGMWLLIHAGIKFNPLYWKGPGHRSTQSGEQCRNGLHVISPVMEAQKITHWDPVVQHDVVMLSS